MIIPMPNEKKQGLYERFMPAGAGFLVTAFAVSQIGDPKGYTLVCMLIIAIATAVAFELHSVLTHLGLPAQSRLSTWAACAFPSFCVWQTTGSLEGWLVAVLAVIIWPIARSMSRMEPPLRWMGLLFSFIYVGLPLALLQMDILPTSPHLAYEKRVQIVLFLVAIKGMDFAGYFVGTYFGRNKLAPLISPKKTWEGFLAGVVFSTSLVACISFFLLNLGVEKSFYMAMTGSCLSLCAQAGDLFESYLKRLAKVKDSGRLPGVGGILDMVDSVLPSIYVLWFFRAQGWI